MCIRDSLYCLLLRLPYGRAVFVDDLVTASPADSGAVTRSHYRDVTIFVPQYPFGHQEYVSCWLRWCNGPAGAQQMEGFYALCSCSYNQPHSCQIRAHRVSAHDHNCRARGVICMACPKVRQRGFCADMEWISCLLAACESRLENVAADNTLKKFLGNVSLPSPQPWLDQLPGR